jgi:predicted  nucleic acid-binding Zn-ribbon protein
MGVDWQAELRRALQLQDLDRQIDALRAERQRLLSDAQEVAARQDVEARRVRAASLEKEIAALDRQQRLQELERQALEAERERNTQRLYGGAVRDPRELEGLQKNVEGTARKIDALETAILEAMERVQTLREQLEEERSALAEAEERLRRIRHRRHVRLGEIDGQLPLLLARREEEARRIDPVVLREYERLRGRGGGVAVAPAGNGACGVCGISLSTAALGRLRAGTVPVTCEHCGRLLVDA